MAIPELYDYGRRGHWFGMKKFTVYMLQAVYQVGFNNFQVDTNLTVCQSVVIFFIIRYTYGSDAARSDGYSPYVYEMSAPMVLAAVFAADLFVGLNTHVWTWWVFFAIALGIVLVWIWTVSNILPDTSVTISPSCFRRYMTPSLLDGLSLTSTATITSCSLRLTFG
jgi:phospholipid-translocating ATPase